jgi:hypothetical protein
MYEHSRTVAVVPVGAPSVNISLRSERSLSSYRYGLVFCAYRFVTFCSKNAFFKNILQISW